MNHTPRSTASAVLAACLLLHPSSSLLGQGNLTPPPGAPTPTMKTLDQVEARKPIGPSETAITISTPGSYYLAGDISVTGDGVSITSADVTLDLNGFTIRKASNTGGNGIAVGSLLNNSARNVTIRNGHISGAFSTGILLRSGQNVTIEDVGLQGMTGNGISTTAVDSSPNIVTIRRCRVLGEPVARIANPPIAAMSIAGISLRFAMAVLVEDCVVANLAGDGIQLLTANSGDQTSSAVIRGCVVSRVGGVGLDLSSNAGTPKGLLIERCTIDQCGGDGVNSTTATRVLDCVALNNTGTGIRTFNHSLISGCVTRDNGANGILVGSDCRVVNNLCSSNGDVAGAGINVTGSDCHIEGNTLTDNDVGLDIDFAGNLIIKNTASGNTPNFDLVADNKVGVIVAVPNSIAISGATGGAGVGTTDPFANLSY